jgi:hypothetical protein
MTGHPFSDDVPKLLIEHRQHLAESAISVDVILDRGYTSVLGKAPIRDAGFNKSQCRPPGILIPLHGVDGAVFGYQYRPDKPRTDSRGRLIKYENPAGSSVRIDVPPRCRQQLADPTITLFITEGVKKGDALASAGVCAIDLNGVWGFKGKNVFGGVAILADFDCFPLKDRGVNIIFDSDSATNPNVKHALDRLTEHLTRKGAKVRRRWLPEGHEGKKTGVDDYLSQGHSVDDILALKEIDEKETLDEILVENAYIVKDGILCWKNPTKRVTVPLCNFNARITEHIVKDDGRDRVNFFRVSGTTHHGRKLPVIDVKADSFSSMGWVIREWGLQAIIEPGQNNNDRLRHAIQLQSQNAPVRQVFTYIGWRNINGDQVYLNAGGGIGPDGVVEVDVELDRQLERYVLPAPLGDPVAAFNESRNFLLVGELHITLPIWAAIYLSPLTPIMDTGFTMWYVGPSGAYKSTVISLALCHFGNFNYQSLPASWSSTENDLEKLCFLVKDCVLVIDDWHPGEDAMDARKLGIKAGRIIRAQGNRQGRGRMKSDRSLDSGYPPQGIVISSGEQLPSGHSQMSRVVTVEMEKTDIFREVLTDAQRNSHLYPVAMAHYIQWLSRNWNKLAESLPAFWQDQRELFYQDSRHARMAGDIASLCTGLYVVTKFGVEIGALSEKEGKAILDDGVVIFGEMVASQGERVEEERPAKRWRSVMGTLINQGRAVFGNVDDEKPRALVPGTFPVGWRDNNGTYFFEPKSAFSAVYQYCQAAGQPFTFKEEAVWKDCVREGLSKKSPDGRTKITKRIYGEPIRVIEIQKRAFSS